MLGRPDIFRVAAILVLIAVCLSAAAAINRRPIAPGDEAFPAAANSASDDLSAELRRCDALGPRDAEDPRCVAVWEENRRRFFGKPVRPLPGTAVPANAATAREAGAAR